MNDTIAAISTAQGVGAISIIRVSGPDAFSIVNKVFTGKDLTNVPSHTIHYGKIIVQNSPIDEVLVTVMKAPKTFTREDIVEINCHGGIAPTNKVLELILSLIHISMNVPYSNSWDGRKKSKKKKIAQKTIFLF